MNTPHKHKPGTPANLLYTAGFPYYIKLKLLLKVNNILKSYNILSITYIKFL